MFIMSRRSVQKLEEEVKKLKAKQALYEEGATDRHLQDQVRQEDMLVRDS